LRLAIGTRPVYFRNETKPIKKRFMKITDVNTVLLTERILERACQTPRACLSVQPYHRLRCSGARRRAPDPQRRCRHQLRPRRFHGRSG